MKVHYRGTLEDGSEFDSSASRDPIEFTIGSGEVIPGFDEAVTGLEPGESRSVTLTPDRAYGEPNEQLVHCVSLADFAEEPVVGYQVQLVAPDGTPLLGEVAAIEGDEVTLDFNHPLAGKTLVFEIELVEVASA